MAQVIAKIVTQHAEEAAFVWLLRDHAMLAPHYKLNDLKRIDERIEAHIDGLRVAGDEGWKIAWQQAEDKTEPGELFAAAVLAFEDGEADMIDKVLALAAPKPELARAVVSATGWIEEVLAPLRLASLLANRSPAVRRIGLAGHAIRRLNPGPAMEKSLNDPDLDLRARALKMIGEMGYAVWLPVAKKHLTINHLSCRFHAARSTALLANDPAAVAELQAIALTECGYRQRAAEIAVRRLDLNAAHRWLGMLASLPGGERLAIQGAAALGDPASVPKLVEAMKQPALARLAGEAFIFITGVHIAYDKLDGDPPEGFEPGPNEDALDERVSMDPDDGLDWPDVAKVTAWWLANQGRFPKGVRHLAGQPITLEWAGTVVQTERQRLRAAAAIEMMLKNPKVPMIEVRAKSC